jgi:hypothetical protein
MRALRVALVAVLSVGVGLAMVPRTAEACGGFFCSQNPVDQSAERIVFAKNGPNVIAFIQIVFNGNAEDFAWVVPVATVPLVDVADSTIFQDLDQATGPIIISPPCFNSFGGSADSEAAGGGGSGRSDDGVIVYDEADIGPYHYATVGSEDSSLLVAWLNENGYIITDGMIPMVDLYVESGMLFLAMKLQVGEEVSALVPIRMEYEADLPVVPIRLTAVAADPNMGVIVYLLGEGRGVPSNYANPTLDDDRIRFNDSLQSNYRTLVTQTVDEAGGHAFITEYAGPTDEIFVFNDSTQELIDDYAWVTRLYMTISPEEMTLDPVFTFNPSLPAVSNIHDFSDRDDLCTGETNPCDFNYCGTQGTCYEVNGEAACDCEEGYVARGITDLINGVGVACVPSDRNLLEDIIEIDPCLSTTCGQFGECISVNGRATCACDEGYAALSNPDGSISCTDISDAEIGDTDHIPGTFGAGSGGGLAAGEELDEGACSVGPTGNGLSDLSLVGLVLFGMMLIRRRRTA